MRKSISDIILFEAKDMNKNDIESLISDIETTLLLVRFQNRNYNLSFNRELYLNPNKDHIPNEKYVFPFAIYLYYKTPANEVNKLVKDFSLNYFPILSEIDFERTSSGATRAFTNARFALNTLKDIGVISNAKENKFKRVIMTENAHEEFGFIIHDILNGHKIKRSNLKWPIINFYFHDLERLYKEIIERLK